ncbi:hypothetical protein F3Y22_tig00117056pilonHSYRG00893 [Hibiscus syriacus]|uniref:Uncharacterized protein n=1 Tax=Hibiscus syriacus TaxID=106335 RepID=A0A6A2W9N4_HIBSY|nr:hypothetical protein F3Y22_tig00117056pilonHSYRG00893 [Hibiscus syriacus]
MPQKNKVVGKKFARKLVRITVSKNVRAEVIILRLAMDRGSSQPPHRQPGLGFARNSLQRREVSREPLDLHRSNLRRSSLDWAQILVCCSPPQGAPPRSLNWPNKTLVADEAPAECSVELEMSN